MSNEEQRAKHADAMRKYRSENREEYNRRHREYRAKNAEQRRQYDKDWRQKNLEHAREMDRLRYQRDKEKRKKAYYEYYHRPEIKRKYLEKSRARNYGLEPEQFESMLISSCGRCDICSAVFLPPKEPHVDHSHATGKVRGLLCSNCNTGLGQFKESAELLELAIKYLKEH